jgi:hypothetical protein
MEKLQIREEVANLPHDDVTEQYMPSKQEALSRYEINIQFMSRGCVIRVGCKTIPFSSTEEAIAELKKYFENPYDTQEQWNKQLL